MVSRSLRPLGDGASDPTLIPYGVQYVLGAVIIIGRPGDRWASSTKPTASVNSGIEGRRPYGQFCSGSRNTPPRPPFAYPGFQRPSHVANAQDK